MFGASLRLGAEADSASLISSRSSNQKYVALPSESTKDIRLQSGTLSISVKLSAVFSCITSIVTSFQLHLLLFFLAEQQGQTVHSHTLSTQLWKPKSCRLFISNISTTPNRRATATRE